jgi:HAD domain in Swiss Army Knife RNA repair proteins
MYCAMKVIFLDIDGVLKTTVTPRPDKDSRVIEETLLARLKTLLQDTGAIVVLSSTWRHDREGLASAKGSASPLRTCLPICGPILAARKLLCGWRVIRTSNDLWLSMTMMTVSTPFLPFSPLPPSD